MSETDSTLEQSTAQDAVLQAIAELSKKIDGIINRLDNHDSQFKSIDVQLEAIREGISHNASRFDRLESQVYSVRSDISALKADVRDLGEEIRRDKIALQK